MNVSVLLREQTVLDLRIQVCNIIRKTYYYLDLHIPPLLSLEHNPNFKYSLSLSLSLSLFKGKEKV